MGEHAGHRKRMFSRLAEGTLCDHEYLEMLLFYAIPRRNTNDIAHRLLARFGDLNGVLNAPLQALQEIDGVGEASVIVYEKEGDVENVVVVCEGANDLRVVMNVREAVASALGTEQNSVKIYLKKE